MIRSFLPVGQGAFYTEQFDCGVNVVYDCGSSTSRSAIEKQIACTFEPREKIQAVFISHLHEDHINGLPFLLSHCCVERLYLPFLTEEEILLTRLIARLENHLKGELGDEALSLSSEIRRQLDVLALQREERLRQAAEERRREAAAFQLWQERQAARDEAGTREADGNARPVPEAPSWPPRDNQPQPPPILEEIEPLSPLPQPDADAQNGGTVSQGALFNDILSVIRCTWQLSRRRKK